MSEVATPAAGGQGAAAPAAPAAAPAAAAPAAPALSWLPSADETTVGYVQNKGWTEPGQVLDGYRNLEKLIGHDRAGRTVVLPKDDASADELNAFYGKLGRPATPDDYRIAAPTGGDADFAKAAAAKFHELGLTSKQAAALVEWNNTQGEGLKAADLAAAQARFADDDRALKGDWGNAYTQNLNQAQAAVRGLGISAEQIDQLSSSLGHKATMELFQKIGSRMGEAEFVSGGKNEKFGQALTPGQAKAEISALRVDKDFTAKLLNRDAEAQAKWTRLHQFAFPEQKEG